MTKPPSKKAARETWRTVLVLSRKTVGGAMTRRQASRIHRFYRIYRTEHGMPDRCDNKDCMFHLESLEWIGKPLRLILDHADGNRWNNLPSNLHYLCPNCDSQSPWYGGKNRGRVIESTEDGYVYRDRKGGLEVGATGRIEGTSEVLGVGATAAPKRG